MVERAPDDLPLRSITPKPLRAGLFDGTTKQEDRFSNPTLGFGGTSDLHAIVSAVISPGDQGPFLSSEGSGPDFLLDRDPFGDTSDPSYMPDHARPGNSRRGSHSQSNSSRRQQAAPLPTSSAANHTPSPTQNRPEVPRVAPTTFQQGSPAHYPTSSASYQRQGYGGTYTMSPQPSLALAHTPPSFSYTHSYQHARPPEGGMMPQNLHTGYQPMMQPHSPVYQYQGAVRDSGSAAYSNPALYSHPGTSASPSPMSSHASQPAPVQGTNHSPTYAAPGQFHSLRYQTPYTYSPQSFPTSPVYQSPYGPAPYPQTFASTPSESDGQGIWYYLPHGVPSRQYEGTPPYQGHYPVGYAPVALHDGDSPYIPPSSSSLSPPAYLGPPGQSPSRFSPDGLFSPDGVGHSSPALSGRHDTPSPKPDTTSSSSALPEKPVVRRPYHPNPPAHRSEWVMWAGNVPSDASHDELWRFFNEPPPTKPPEDPGATGVLSIFLISRSSCAFINFESEAHLQDAITTFNGRPLRPADPRCPRLVCRVRRKDDDLKAGVGGQRGMGMHIKWIRDRKGKERNTSDALSEQSESDGMPQTPSSGRASLATPPVSVSSDDEGRPPARPKGGHSSSSGSGSFASTNSSVLTRYFPKRYFILKSLTQYDLDLSAEKGLWATQKHNEGILDQAYRTSQEVYLIFGVNKSGEFYGYAKMAGPIRQGEQRVPWAQRTDSGSSRSSLSPSTGRGSIKTDTIPEEPDSPTRRSADGSWMLFSKDTFVEESPQPYGTPERPPPDAQGSSHSLTANRPPIPSRSAWASAPAEMNDQHHKLTLKTPLTMLSLDQGIRAKPESGDDFNLDPSAPIKAMKHTVDSVNSPTAGSRLRSVAEEEDERKEDSDGVVPDGAGHGSEGDHLGRLGGGGPRVNVVDGVDGAEKPKEETWGEPFKIEWVCTERLPFYRTRHIRNPWNHDREVKVSRDGTELEPSVGAKLIEEWEKVVESQDAVPLDGATRKLADDGRRLRGGMPIKAKTVDGLGL